MERRILVTVRGQDCEEKADAVAKGIRQMLEAGNIINADVELQEELKVFSFMNVGGGTMHGKQVQCDLWHSKESAAVHDR